jgi:hypothetical protein
MMQIDYQTKFTIKAATVMKTHFWDLSLNDFYTSVSNNPRLLLDIHLSWKNKMTAQEYGTFPPI